MKDFFISYNKADREWAEWIAWQLEEAGHTTMLQAWDFRPGSNFVLEMQRAASEATRTIAVLSPDYLAALYTQPEWAAGFAQDPTGEEGRLVPVRVRECELKGLLGQITYIDLVGLNEAAAKDTLLTGVRFERAKPTTAPPFPGARPRSVTERPRFPGGLPAIWNVPHLRNPNFTGREELLRDLRTALTAEQRAALTQAITGLGGVGKTQLAIEYAYRHTGEYSVVWWVRAEEPSTLAADYAGLADQLDLPEKGAKEQNITVEAVRRWLGHNTGWLLVFDNVPDPSRVRDYLPQGRLGHVIITSRDPSWRGLANPLPVKVLPREQAVEFLLRRTAQTDKDAARKLAEALGDLPLVLEQAGAFMEKTEEALSGYLGLFRQQRAELLCRPSPSTDATVATTWEISFQRIERDSPAAAFLLNLCAFLAPDDIPLDIILPEGLAATVANAVQLEDAIGALRHFSLVERSGENLSVHRLVQAVTRERLAEDSRKLWAGAAVRIVNRAFPQESPDVRTWPQCARLLPHALAAADHAESLRVALEQTGRLLNQTGMYLHGRAEYAQARAAIERALKIGEAAYGPDHPTVAIRVNNLALVLNELGDLAGARAHLERALRIGEAAYGPDHPTVAISVNNLGEVLRALGDLVEARAHFERALKIDEAAYGSDHPTVATIVNNLGNVLESLGDLAGAQAHYERALRIAEAAYGPDHPDVATCVNNLGGVLKALGDLAGARAHGERALEIFRKFLGETHPTTVLVRKNLEALGDKGKGTSAG